MIPNITLFDLSVGLIYLFIIYFFAIKLKRKMIKNQNSYQLFLLALTLKIIGGISFAIISVFYYQQGDTFLYFQLTESINNHLLVDFKEAIDTLFTSYSNLQSCSFNPIEPYNYYYARPTTWNFSRFLLVFNVLGFGSYWLTTIIISVFSFVCLWLAYLSFTKLYPNLYKMFFIPFF